MQSDKGESTQVSVKACGGVCELDRFKRSGARATIAAKTTSAVGSTGFQWADIADLGDSGRLRWDDNFSGSCVFGAGFVNSNAYSIRVQSSDRALCWIRVLLSRATAARMANVGEKGQEMDPCRLSGALAAEPARGHGFSDHSTHFRVALIRSGW